MLESTSRLIRVYEHASGINTAYTIPGALFSEEEYTRFRAPVSSDADPEIKNLTEELWLLKGVNAVYIRPSNRNDQGRCTEVLLYRNLDRSSYSWTELHNQVYLALRRHIKDWKEGDISLEHYIISSNTEGSSLIQKSTLHSMD